MRAFHFFVALTIASFLSWTVAPVAPIAIAMSAMAQENATTTEEIINNESLIINDDANATSTEEIINDEPTCGELVEPLTINDDANATSTEEIINDEPTCGELDEPLIINDNDDDDANATTTEEIINDEPTCGELDEPLIINDNDNDDANATTTEEGATTTDEIVNDEGLTINDCDSAINDRDSLIEIEFTNVYYGQVSENQEFVAPRITTAVVRNVGDVPAAIMLWQDDMGVGKENIRYGARMGEGEWIYYGSFEMIILPDVLMPGESVEMEFSVKVLNFPVTGFEKITDYQGIMTINGIAAPLAEDSLPLLNEILSDDSDLKPEADEQSLIVNL